MLSSFVLRQQDIGCASAQSTLTLIHYTSSCGSEQQLGQLIPVSLLLLGRRERERALSALSQPLYEGCVRSVVVAIGGRCTAAAAAGVPMLSNNDGGLDENSEPVVLSGLLAFDWIVEEI